MTRKVWPQSDAGSPGCALFGSRVARLACRGTVGVLVAVMWALPAGAEIVFDKLTNCGGVAAVDGLLRSTPADLISSCRVPDSPAERLFLGGQIPAGFCLLKKPPVPFLRDFSCIASANANITDLLCFRPARASDIAQYKEHNTQEPLASLVNKYKADSAKCPTSNATSADAQRTLSPPIINAAAKFDFGFVLPLGRGRMTYSRVLHAFATIAPGIATPQLDAVEYIYFYRGSPEASSENVIEIGPWALGSNQASEKAWSSAVEEGYRTQGATAFMDNWIVSIEKRDGVAFSDADKRAFLNGLEDALGRSLVQSGFEPVTANDLTAAGTSIAGIREQAVKSMGFGKLGLINILERMGLFESKRSPLCTSMGGSIIAIVIAFGPTPNVQSEFGGIALVIAGVGQCGLRAGATKALSVSAMKGARDALISALRTSQ